MAALLPVGSVRYKRHDRMFSNRAKHTPLRWCSVVASGLRMGQSGAKVIFLTAAYAIKVIRKHSANSCVSKVETWSILGRIRFLSFISMICCIQFLFEGRYMHASHPFINYWMSKIPSPSGFYAPGCHWVAWPFCCMLCRRHKSLVHRNSISPL